MRYEWFVCFFKEGVLSITSSLAMPKDRAETKAEELRRKYPDKDIRVVHRHDLK